MSNEELEKEIQHIISHHTVSKMDTGNFKLLYKLFSGVVRGMSILLKENLDSDIDYFIITILFMLLSITIVLMNSMTEKMDSYLGKLAMICIILTCFLCLLIIIARFQAQNRFELNNDDKIKLSLLSQQISDNNAEHLREIINWRNNTVNNTAFHTILIGLIMSLFTKIFSIIEICNVMNIAFIFFILTAVHSVILTLENIQEKSFKNEKIIVEFVLDEYHKRETENIKQETNNKMKQIQRRKKKLYPKSSRF